MNKNKQQITYLTIIALSTALMYVVGLIFEKMGLGGIALSYVKINPSEGFILIPLLLLGVKAGLLSATAYLGLMAVSGVGFSGNPAGIGFFAMALALFTFIGGYVLGSFITRVLRPHAERLGNNFDGQYGKLWFTLTAAIATVLGSFAGFYLTDVLQTNWNEFARFALSVTTGLFIGVLITLSIASRFREPYRGYINLIFAVLIVTVVMTIANYWIITPSYIVGKWTTVGGAIAHAQKEWFTTWTHGDVWWMVVAPPAGIIHGNILKYTTVALTGGAILSSRSIWKYKMVNTKSGNPRVDGDQ